MRLAASIILSILLHLSHGQVDFEKGKSLIESSEFEAAQSYFQNQLDSCKHLCQDTTIAYLHVYLGRAFKLSNKSDSALSNYKTGIELFKKKGHRNGQAFGLTSLAELYRSIIEFDKALDCLKEVEEISETHDLSPQNLAYFYNRYAAVINETTYEYPRIVDYSNKVLEIAVSIGDQDMEASSLNELGFLHERMNNPVALEYFKKAYEIYFALGNIRYATSIVSNLARASYAFQRHDESIRYAQLGLRLCKDKGWVKVEPELYNVLYKNYNHFGQTALALTAHENYHRTYLQAREVEWDESRYQIEAKYELAEKERQLSDIKHNEDLARLESEQKSRQLNFSVIVGLLLILMMGMLFWAYKKTKKSNALLSNSLDQKEVLRQEMHHRVKNNLTFLKSLLYLRSNASDDENVKLILDECQSRIQAMALVHQNLYDTENTSEVDFKEFLEELYVELRSMFQQPSKIDLDISVENLKIDMKMSVFVGLILNEMITNSFKYAFVDGENGKIDISMNDIGQKFELSYSDSGQGLPEDFDLKDSKGFGFRLINILVSQINANLQYEQNGMSTFKITIPK